jgi:hypothetical protein
VAADTLLLVAPMSIDDDRTPAFPQDLMGVRAQSARSHVDEYLVRNSLAFDNDHPLYFQILPILFSCGLKGGVTPTETTGGQGDYLWTFTPSMTAANSPNAGTLEAGDDVQAFECEYVTFERYRIEGVIDQSGGISSVTGAQDFFARQWSTAAFTTSIAIPTTENMNAKQARFYLDTAWASLGNTEKTNTLRRFAVEILTGVHPKFYGSANKYFDTIDESFIDVMASFTLEGNATADAIWDAKQAETKQFVRLTITGAQIGTGTNHKLTIDMAGKWESVIPLAQNEQGNNLHTAVLHGIYDTTGAQILALTVTTNVSAI